mgnify:CR=1 FL=1
MDFITDFIKRGYHYQCTDLEGLRKITNERKIAAYIGFDCTAKSLHVGNLMQIMILRLMQQYGHKPIVIIGGATTKLGDPTGKDEMRKKGVKSPNLADALLMAASLINEVKERQDIQYVRRATEYKEESLFAIAGVR